MEVKQDDVVMCTVKSIDGTTVFLEIDGNGQGSMVMSEVAAGRIRNLREYVSVNKKIVCKVLKISNGNIQLSLRRVTGKEREEIQDHYKKEKTFLSMLKTIVKEPEQLVAKIKEKYEVWEFFDKIKESPELLEAFLKKADADSLTKILSERKDKERQQKKIIIIRTSNESGMKDIREVLNHPEIDIRYLGSSQFSLTATAKDFKEASAKLEEAVKEIEKKAKEKKVHFELK